MNDTFRYSDEANRLRRGIERLQAGDTSVRGELLNIAHTRLMRLTDLLRRDFPDLVDPKSSEEVFQSASQRLYLALYDKPIKDVRHFYQLAALQIRRELVALCRHCQEPGGIDRRDIHILRQAADGNATETERERAAARELDRWALLHDSIDALPEAQREVFELIWYHEMTRGEAAELLGLPPAEVRRLWRSARLNLHTLLGDESLPINCSVD